MIVKDTKFLNGIKGIAALGVLFHHFCLAFLPGIHYGELVPNYLAEFDWFLSDSAFSVFLNGNFYVTLFIIISSFLVTNKCINANYDGKGTELFIVTTAIKRYLTIVIPVFLISLGIYFIYELGLFENLTVSTITKSPWLASFYTSNLSLIGLLKSSFWGVPFAGDYSFNTVFWMLSYIMWGTLISIVFGILIKLKKEKAIYIVLFMTIVSGLCSSYYFCTLLGVLLSYIYVYQPFKFSKWLLALLLCVGLFLGGYPTGVMPNNYYRIFLKFNYFVSDISILLHSLGAFLLLISLMYLQNSFRFLNSKLLVGLGKITFSIYLVHIPVLFTVGMYSFELIYGILARYMVSVVITAIITTVVVLIMSLLLEKILGKINVRIKQSINSYFLN